MREWVPRLSSRRVAGTIVDERYRLEWLAGMGGMGSVYRATDLVDALPCALKLTAADLADSTRVALPEKARH